MDLKKIVVASDSFKGSLSSAQIADEAEKGIRAVFPDCSVIKLSVADGGEGTVEALVDTLKGRFVNIRANDPLLRPREVTYGIVEGKTPGELMAVIEMSAASGLPLLTPEERNPSLTSTYGTGEMIMDALRRGCRKFLVGIGGSATNDAGTGMLAALGYHFLDADGRELTPCGENLGRIASVDHSAVPAAVKEAQFIVACDVDTPFCGPSGAAYVFARQKGADENMVRRLDEGMSSFVHVVEKYSGRPCVKDIKNIPGTGAAGGLGGGFLAFLNTRLERGVEMVLDAIGFDERVSGADLVITGEGKIDFQTSKGKTPYGVMKRAALQHIPTIAIGGCVEVDTDVVPEEDDFAAIFPIVSGPIALEEAMRPEVASRNVRTTVSRIMNLIKGISEYE